jgi:DNA-binding transcriptional ArsR family regulator
VAKRAAKTVPLEHAGVAVVAHDRSAGILMDPTRRRILQALSETGSATTVADALGLSRQLANYHIRTLEKAGLVAHVGRRAKRGLSERLVRATATHYLISPEILGDLGRSPAESTDRFSASYQVAAAVKTIRDVSEMATRARDVGRRLTTLSLESEVRFATPADREAFANELAHAVSAIVAKHHNASAPDGRAYRLCVHAHPVFIDSPKGTRS